MKSTFLIILENFHKNKISLLNKKMENSKTMRGSSRTVLDFQGNESAKRINDSFYSNSKPPSKNLMTQRAEVNIMFLFNYYFNTFN